VQHAYKITPPIPIGAWKMAENYLGQRATDFEWFDSQTCPAKTERVPKRLTTRERKREDAETAIIKFLILAQAPLSIAGMAAMYKTGANVIADAAYRLEEQGIVYRAKISRLVFLRPPTPIEGSHESTNAA
jgi:hypothetical protein